MSFDEKFDFDGQKEDGRTRKSATIVMVMKMSSAGSLDGELDVDGQKDHGSTGKSAAIMVRWGPVRPPSSP